MTGGAFSPEGHKSRATQGQDNMPAAGNTDVLTYVARKPHTCTWCGQQINSNETYKRWRSFDPGESPFTNKMHLECFEHLSFFGDNGYDAFENERPFQDCMKRPPWPFDERGMLADSSSAVPKIWEKKVRTWSKV